jgi:hypothetical protein
MEPEGSVIAEREAELPVVPVPGMLTATVMGAF